jgi:hypothetical protein
LVISHQSPSKFLEKLDGVLFHQSSSKSVKVFDAGLQMSKCNWTNELVNDLIDLVEEIEVIWNAKAKVYHDKDKRKEAILFFDIWTDLFLLLCMCAFCAL